MTIVIVVEPGKRSAASHWRRQFMGASRSARTVLRLAGDTQPLRLSIADRPPGTVPASAKIGQVGSPSSPGPSGRSLAQWRLINGTKSMTISGRPAKVSAVLLEQALSRPESRHLELAARGSWQRFLQLRGQLTGA